MISNVLKGMAMGIAEVIPGVSGGTIAFITGIYERLLNCIRAFNPSLIGSFKKDGLAGVWRDIDGNFLFTLMMGMATGFVVGIFGITYLLEEYPTPLWGFFFGLILASSIYIARLIPKWNIKRWLNLIIGFIIAFGITTISPVEGSTHPLMIFLAGVIAISALILPGISGSFMLLLMGMYTIIIPSIKSLLKDQDVNSLVIVTIFGLGCIVGLAGFSRVLTWLFKNYKESTFALLTGFMLGSLNKIWPWRNIVSIMDKESGLTQKLFQPRDALLLPKENYKILSEQNVLPQSYEMGDALVFVTIISLVIGFVIVFILEKYQKK